jgi:hypothetical protein
MSAGNQYRTRPTRDPQSRRAAEGFHQMAYGYRDDEYHSLKIRVALAENG